MSQAVPMRAKLFISKVERHGTGDNAQDVLTMHGVSRKDSYPEDGSDENNTYAKFSPSVSLQITIANPALVGVYSPGDTFYVDFEPIEGERTP